MQGLQARRRRVLVCGVLLGIVVATAVVRWRSGGATAPTDRAGTPHAQPQAASNVRLALPTAPASAVPVSAPAAEGLVGHPREVVRVEYCGLGEVDAAATDGDVLSVAQQQQALAGLQRVAQQQSDPALRGLVALFGHETEGDVGQQRRAAARQELVNAAATGQDPWLYGLAMEVCRYKPGPGMCGLLSLQRWAEVDPDNASPWLFLADHAWRQGDEVAAVRALEAAAHARVSWIPSQRLVRTIDELLPIELPQWQRVHLVMQAIGVWAASPLPGMGVVTGLCTNASLAQPDRRAVCERWAEAAVRRPAHFVERSLGVRIGQRLGWPRERLRELHLDYAAMTEVHRDELVGDIRQVYGCTSYKSVIDMMRRQAEVGEVETIRELLLRRWPSAQAWLDAAPPPKRQEFEQRFEAWLAQGAASTPSPGKPR